MDARVTLLNVAAAEAAGMTGFSHIIVEGAASPLAKGSSEARQGDLLRAHLQALINGLEALTQQLASGGRDSILLCLSHDYLRKGIEEWLPRWKANGWRNASRKPVAYADLWMMVDALLGRLRASNTGDVLVLRGDPNHNHQQLANQVAERALKIGLNVAAVVGAIVSAIALGKAEPGRKGMAMTGLVLCAIAIVAGGFRLSLGGGIL